MERNYSQWVAKRIVTTYILPSEINKKSSGLSNTCLKRHFFWNMQTIKLSELIVSKYPKVFGYNTWTDTTTCYTEVSHNQLQVRLYDRVRKAIPKSKRKNIVDSDETSLKDVSITRYGKN